jgi:DNA-binding MarR family transcriptional regulator
MNGTPGPESGQWAVHRLVSIAARLHERRLNQRLSRYKLTASAMDAMGAVAQLQPTTATDVAAMLCVSRQSLGRVLRRLESLGFMTKEPGRDGRSAYFRLTHNGRDVLSAAENLLQEGTGTESADEYEFRQQLETTRPSSEEHRKNGPTEEPSQRKSWLPPRSALKTCPH